MKIILISGKAEAGKTTTAKILRSLIKSPCLTEHHRVALVPYGQYVKDTAKMLFDWNGEKDESGRKLLQWWGTDVVRKTSPDFWVDTVMRLADIFEAANGFDYLIIDDCRFPNEIDAWKNSPKWNDILTIRVERPGHENGLTPEQREHPSETSMDDYPTDVVLSATNSKELYDDILEKIVFKKLLTLKGEQLC